MSTPPALPAADARPVWCASIALTGWREMPKIVIPAMIMMFVQWCGLEVNLFFCDLLCKNADGSSSCVDLDVFPMVSNIMVVAFMTHVGFSIFARKRVGNA